MKGPGRGSPARADALRRGWRMRARRWGLALGILAVFAAVGLTAATGAPTFSRSISGSPTWFGAPDTLVEGPFADYSVLPAARSINPSPPHNNNNYTPPPPMKIYTAPPGPSSTPVTPLPGITHEVTSPPVVPHPVISEPSYTPLPPYTPPPPDNPPPPPQPQPPDVAPVAPTPGALKLSSSTIPLGGDEMATGQGCLPGAPVSLAVGDVAVGEAVADPTGSFETELATASVDIGPHQVTAQCGLTLAAPLNVVLVSHVGTGTATLTVIMVFLVIGVWFYTRRLALHMSTRRIHAKK